MCGARSNIAETFNKMAEGSHSYISGRLLQGEEPKVNVPYGHVERRKISTLARNTISLIIQIETW